jgi:hypothetical protein
MRHCETNRCIGNELSRQTVLAVVRRFAPIENIDFIPEMTDKNERWVPGWNGVQQMAPLNRWEQTSSGTDSETDHRDESGLKLERVPERIGALRRVRRTTAMKAD